MQPIINTLLDPVVNFGKVTVLGGHTDNIDDTGVTLIAGDGSKLPNPADLVNGGSFNLVWFNNSTYSDPADDPYVEIVRCITRSNDTLIVIRGQEGTSASAKNIPTKIYKMILSPTKKTIDDIQTESQSKVDTHSALSTGIHGVGTDTIDGVGARNIAISIHSSTTSSVHGFNASGDAPAQAHGISKHDVTTIDGGVTLPIGQLPVHGASKHTGTIGTWANIDKTTSNIADITTKSHTSLTDIGSNTHTQIDTAITASMGHIAANGTSVHNLGTMSTQAANNVSITGGSITSITGLTVSGNVGIGTTSPETKLHVQDGSGSPLDDGAYLNYLVSRFKNTGSGNQAYVEIRSALTGNCGLLLKPYTATGTSGWGFITNNSGDLRIAFGSGITDLKDGIGGVNILASNNYVGIGLTNPTAKLHIGGTPGVDGIKFPDGTLQTTAVTSGPTLVGVTPTLSGSWATAPAPLSEIVDGDEVAFTTAGAINWGAGRCYITLDSGSTKPGILLYYFSTGRSGSTGADHILEASPNGSTWTTILAANTAGTTQSGIFGMQGIRYVRFSIDTTNTGTAYLYNLSLTLK